MGRLPRHLAGAAARLFNEHIDNLADLALLKRALLAGESERARLRCVVVGLKVTDGLGHAAPMIVDTSASQLRGTGTVRFPAERLDMRLTGAPKSDGLLRLPGAAFLTGTLSAPEIVVPAQVKSVGNVLKALGRAITGKQEPRAGDADCAALSARVLGS